MTIHSQQGLKKSSLCMPPPPLPTTNLAAASLRKHPIDILGANNGSNIGQGPPQLSIVPPLPLPGSASGLLGSRPSNNSSPSSSPNQDRMEPNSISVIGNRSNMPFPLPPPPFGFPPVDPHVFPPSMRPPPVPVPPLGMLPPLGPNVQPPPTGLPPPFSGADFRPYSGSGILPHPSDQRGTPYDQDYDERNHKRSQRSYYDDYDTRSSR
ncbi:hypothetical protein BLA29_007036, partial [Euroglyphus maynei]